MFLEAVLNDTIASENMTLELYENFDIGPDKFEKYNFDFDLYIDRIAFFHKIQVLFEKNGKYDFQNDKEYIELKHLVSIRDSLAHLKPIKFENSGYPKHKISKAALNYLTQKKKVVEPFGKGVNWIDRVSNKEMAEWALETLKQSIEYFYDSTFSPPVGITQLEFYCMRLAIGKFRQ